MKNSPKVSICIPTYNSEKHLEKSLISIENQTYTNVEVIIADNNSSDQTVAIIKKFSKKNGWKYVLNEENIGAGLNMNKLVSLATGELIAIYHSDDVYHSEIVDKSVSFFNSNPYCGFVSTLATVIDSDGKDLEHLGLPLSLKSKGRDFYEFEEIFSAILDSFLPFLITPTVMVRKDVYDQLGHFKIHEHYKSAGDYEMWFRILKHYSAGIIPESLIKYRKHDQQGSQTEIRENYGLPDGLIVYEEYSKGNKFLEKKYQRAYSYLLMLQALKLNDKKDFESSTCMIKLIQQNGNFIYSSLATSLNILNYFSIRFNNNHLIGVKRLLSIKTK